MSSTYPEILYQFHKELSRPFAGSRELLSAALRAVGRRIAADRLTSFVLEPGEMILSAEFSLSSGSERESEEEIAVLDAFPISRLARGKIAWLAYSSPHPLLYVRVGGRGILRLERSVGRAFSASEKKLAARLAEELTGRLEEAEASERSRRQLRQAKALTGLTALFAASLRVDDGLKLILQGIQGHFALDRVRLYLVDRASKTLKGEFGVDMRRRIRTLRFKESPMEPKAHRFVDLLLDNRVDSWTQRYRHSVLHIPLNVQGQVIGLLVMDNLVSQAPISEEDAAILQSFAGQIALAVDNSRLFEEVQALSLHDDLTGLPLRRYFLQRAQEEWYRAQRAGQPLAVGLLDIDYFKSINDTYGHQIGDEVLRAVGRKILATLRKVDFPCRYGGDEILILLPQAGAAEACRIMERLAQGLKELRVAAPFSRAQEVRITVSIGVASGPADGATMEELIQRADEALYRVKAGGRDGVAAYSRFQASPGAPGSEAIPA